MTSYKYGLSLFACLYFIDYIFGMVSFGQIELIAVARMLAVSFALAIILSFALKKASPKVSLILGFLVLLLFGAYAFLELQFKNFLNGYYSFQQYAAGGFRVGVFAWYFIKTAKPQYWLTLLPAFAFLLINLKNKAENKVSLRTFLLSLVIFAVVMFTLPYGSLNYRNAYENQDNFDFIVRETGVNTFFFEDIAAVLNKKEDRLIIEDTTAPDATAETSPEPTETPEVIEKDPLVREFDDSRWIADMEKETDETVKSIDQFLLNRKVEQKNEKTGIYEGYNFIYFLVESLDYVGIDPELTPTIYKMMTEGYQFPNHYTPVFSCGTGDSELVSMTSMMPYGSACTVYTATPNDLNNSMAALFKRAGYDTFSFHNWDDQFYDRTELHHSYGIDVYKDIDDLDIPIVQGWQSDNVLMEQALPDFIHSDKFFTFIVTSTMHWPYDEYSYYGNHYLEEINKVHPEYPIELKRFISKTMEFDKSLETLLNALEEEGKLDNTVICFWPDHHPFNLDTQVIRKYTQYADRYGTHGFYKSPLILYCASTPTETVENVCSTFDHVPTIANLFGLNYDPRLYMGTDIFNGDTRVMFANGDWITDDGIYSVSSGSFAPFEGRSLSDNEVERISAEVRNLIKVGRAIVDTDYFHLRNYITDPVEKE